MTATKGKPRRFSREQQQENLSRAQFEARLSEPEIGWIPSTVKTDMGEDLHVRIYDKGASTNRRAAPRRAPAPALEMGTSRVVTLYYSGQL